jgi:Tfp pilus assembly protein PilX
MKNLDKRIQVVVRGEDGVILGIAMMMLLLLTLLGILVISLSSSNIQSAAYQKMSTQSFSGAESGLTQSRNDMAIFVAAAPQNGQWPAADTTVANGAMGGLPQKSYNLTVQGQPVKFVYTIADIGNAGDKTVLVNSTGTYNNVQQRVEAVYLYEPPSGEPGSQTCQSATCQSVDNSSAKTVTNNVNSQATLF